jgi:hypothetical protein
MNAVDETIEESADYDGATLEPEWDPFGEEEQINNAGIPSNQSSRSVCLYKSFNEISQNI